MLCFYLTLAVSQAVYISNQIVFCDIEISFQPAILQISYYTVPCMHIPDVVLVTV